jgi:hypothetical protein
MHVMPLQSNWMALQEKNMIMRKALVSALFAAGTIAGVAMPTASMAQLDINLSFGPPAAIYEPIPAPRSGYIWQGGHWNWDGNRHVWNAGNWQALRPGYSYYAPRWVENNGRWSYQASRWDRDGDGIPNSRDATPNGVARRSDRDGDGVPNNRDRYPGNPNYR